MSPQLSLLESWNWKTSPVLKAYRDIFILLFVLHGILELNERTKRVNQIETEELNQPAIAEHKFTVGTLVRLKDDPERIYHIVETFSDGFMVTIMTPRNKIGLQISWDIEPDDLEIIHLPPFCDG